MTSYVYYSYTQKIFHLRIRYNKLGKYEELKSVLTSIIIERSQYYKCTVALMLAITSIQAAPHNLQFMQRYLGNIFRILMSMKIHTLQICIRNSIFRCISIGTSSAASTKTDEKTPLKSDVEAVAKDDELFYGARYLGPVGTIAVSVALQMFFTYKMWLRQKTNRCNTTAVSLQTRQTLKHR